MTTPPRQAPASVPARKVGHFDFDRDAQFPNADRIPNSGLPANTSLRFHSYEGEGDSVRLEAKTGSTVRGILRINGAITSFAYIERGSGRNVEHIPLRNSPEIAVPDAIATSLNEAWIRAYRDGRITQAEALQLDRVRQVLSDSLRGDNQFNAFEIRASLTAIGRVAPTARSGR